MALEWSLNGLRSLDRQMQRSVNLILETGKMTPKPVQNANEFNYVCSIAALIWTPMICFYCLFGSAMHIVDKANSGNLK